MTKKLLVIGCGSIGERPLRCFVKTGRADVSACDTNPALLEKMRSEYQVPTFPGLKEALATEKFDGVVICTPAHTHIGVTVRNRSGFREKAADLLQPRRSASAEAEPLCVCIAKKYGSIFSLEERREEFGHYQ